MLTLFHAVNRTGSPVNRVNRILDKRLKEIVYERDDALEAIMDLFPDEKEAEASLPCDTPNQVV
jgi:hypothetical protein